MDNGQTAYPLLTPYIHMPANYIINIDMMFAVQQLQKPCTTEELRHDTRKPILEIQQSI